MTDVDPFLADRTLIDSDGLDLVDARIGRDNFRDAGAALIAAGRRDLVSTVADVARQAKQDRAHLQPLLARALALEALDAAPTANEQLEQAEQARPPP